jgi:AraC-like DNA-binding protein
VGTWTELRSEAERWEDLPGLHVMKLAEAYRRRGIDVVVSLPRFGLPWTTLRGDMRLDYRRVVAWSEHVLEQWPVPGIGFDRAFRTRLPRYGVPGYMLLSAESFGRAIEQWQRFSALFRPYVGTGLRLQGDSAELFVVEPDPPPFGATMQRFCMERWLAGWQSALRSLLGEQFSFTDVRCACPPHDEAAEPYRRLFHGPVHFDSVETALRFPAQWLAAQTRFGNAETHRLLAASCDKLLAELHAGGGIRGSVRRLLLRDPVGLGSPDAVAEALGMSERSLRRKLLDAHSAFSDLLHEARMALALDHLRHTQRPIGEIARRLGYSEESAFARAFKRTFGQTPRSARSTGLVPPFDAETQL